MNKNKNQQDAEDLRKAASGCLLATLKIVVIIYGLALLLSALASCNRGPDSGLIVDKHYEPERTYFSLLPVYNGKSFSYIPVTNYDGEDFILVIQATKRDGIIYRNVYVSPECYYSSEIGETWQRSNDCTFRDENNTRERE